jgi:micrococcal nuclease
MLKSVLTLALGLAATPAFAHHPYDLRAANSASTPLRVIDGDTIQYGKRTVRAVGYDTPEKGKLAKCDAERALSAKANARFTELISPPHVFTLKWAKGSDKYGRGLALFYSDHKEIGRLLIAEGLAQPYGGGAKASWCK